MSDQPFPTGIYRHHKGDTYTFILVAEDEATGQLRAIYRSKTTLKVYDRPLAEFCEPRFLRVFPEPEPDNSWEHFYKVADRLPKAREGTVIAKLATGVKVGATYEDGNWRCYDGQTKHFNWGQLLTDVVEWRYLAGK